MKLARMALLALLLSTPALTTAAGPTEYAYRKGQTDAVDVLDLQHQRLIETNLARQGGKKGKAGTLTLCTDAQYFCIQGDIEFAVPRVLAGQKQWQYAGIQCSADLPLTPGRVVIATCRKSRVSKVWYSPTRGVIGYGRQPDLDYTYELLPSYGLFAEEQLALDRKTLREVAAGASRNGYRGASLPTCTAWKRIDGTPVPGLALDPPLQKELLSHLGRGRLAEPRCWYLSRMDEIQLWAGQRCQDQTIIVFEWRDERWLVVRMDRQNLQCDQRR